MDLEAYFERIGFREEPRPDLVTLKALHRAHLQAVPYENLDVQFGRPLTTDPAEAVEKIVARRRGGWCYEMNGVFGAALTEIGFKVTGMAGAAMRELMGDIMIGNHLVLLVEIDGQHWIADVGFGDGCQDPIPLRRSAINIGGYAFRLEALDERWWRFHNHEFGGARSFDFVVEPADPDLLAGRCEWLQQDPTSPFVLNLIVQRFRADTILQLRGRVFRTVTPRGVETRLLRSADELVAVLASDFGLDVPEAAGLWPRVVARHEEVLAAAEAGQNA
ncbi:arylamine N-acetyltransferase family protein [Phenylobacterium sp.]|jgi:N-hydroxyarylamine O-acetyltransferase|uniref:arylamine N-acetyltransferase family protein n=1 Tax=Phenylobacterium sp. TaxID=1871053 RepID=UPI002F4250D0